VFGDLWGPLGCLGCLWTAIGAPFVTFGGSNGAPLERNWAPFVASGGPLDAFGGHWGHLRRHFWSLSEFSVPLKVFGICLKKKYPKQVQIVSWTHYLCAG